MNITIINKIRQIIRCFETGKVEGADYGAYVVFADGPNNRRQITYGASQTTEFGNLKTLLEYYVTAQGKFHKEFKAYLPVIGDRTKDTLASNPQFVELLKDAADDPVMHQVQDRFFKVVYFDPALSWFERNGFTLPFSLLIIYDSFTHSGSIPLFLRNKFPEKTPSAGGDEKQWITKYVDTRDVWLETNTARPILQNTDYRTDSFIHAIREDNWLLDKPFKVVNYKDPLERDIPIVRQVIP